MAKMFKHPYMLEGQKGGRSYMGWCPYWRIYSMCHFTMDSVGTQLSQPSGPYLHADCKELGTQPSQRQVLTNQHLLFKSVETNFLGPNG